jgi:branched-subunit amino acid aminotransferase/4-amino-4-deoxychorismate lyase
MEGDMTYTGIDKKTGELVFVTQKLEDANTYAKDGEYIFVDEDGYIYEPGIIVPAHY